MRGSIYRTINRTASSTGVALSRADGVSYPRRQSGRICSALSREIRDNVCLRHEAQSAHVGTRVTCQTGSAWQAKLVDAIVVDTESRKTKVFSRTVSTITATGRSNVRLDDVDSRPLERPSR